MSNALFAIGVNHIAEMRSVLDDTQLCARTINEDPHRYPYRAIIRYKDLKDLGQKCELLKQHLDTAGVFANYIDLREGLFLIKGKTSSKNNLAFVYPGQGSQYARMLSQYSTNPAFSRAFEQSMAQLPREFSEAYKGYADNQLIHQTDFTQPLLASVEWALTCWLDELGVSPGYSVGHSFGELTALAQAECYTGNELISLSVERGKIMHQASLTGQGGMIAIIDPSSKSWVSIDEFVMSACEEVELANINSNQQLVYSGHKEDLLNLKKACDKKGLKSSILKTSAAFHSSFIGDSDKAFLQVLEKKASRFKAPKHEVLSNYKSLPYGYSKDIPKHLSRQMTSRVEWLQIMEKLYDSGVRTFIEVGPKKTLTTLLERTLPRGECTFIALDSPCAWTNISLYLWGLGLTNQTVKELIPSPESNVLSNFLSAQQHLLKETNSIEGGSHRDKVVDKIIQDTQEVLSAYINSKAEESFTQKKVEQLEPESEAESESEFLSECKTLSFLKKEVSELTGFSINEITSDADFDDDLALDSITKMDFFSLVIEKMGGQTPDTNDLVSLRTLKQVADYLNELGPRESDDELSKEVQESKKVDQVKLKRKERRSFESALVESIQNYKKLSPDEITSNSHFEKDLGLNVFEREEIFNSLWGSYPYMQVAGRSILNLETVGELVELERGIDRRASVRTEEPVRRFEWKKTALNRNPLAIGKFQSPVLLLPFYVTGDLSDIESYIAGQTELQRYDLTSRDEIDNLDKVVERSARSGELDILFLISPTLKFNENTEQVLDSYLEMIYKLSQKLVEVQRVIPNIELKILMNSYDDALFKGLVGLFRSLTREVDIRMTIVDLAWEGLCAQSIPWDVLWTSKKIKTRCEYVQEKEGTFYHASLDTSYDEEVLQDEEKVHFEYGDPILVLGGGRGISAEISKHLASEYRAHIVAVGRTKYEIDNGACEKNKEIKNTEKSVLERGGLFTYLSVDACDFPLLEKELDSFEVKHGPFRAVIHGVGTTDDAMLKDKSFERFSKVVKTKVLSAINCFKYFGSSNKLQFVCFFSSLSSWTGAPGQTDYSFANEVLNDLANEWRRAVPGLPVSSLLWSVWGESGLASDELLQRMKRMKLGVISNKEGVRLFRNEIDRYGLRSPKVLFSPLSTLRYSERAGKGEGRE